MHLIAGLGNPGPPYARTRHNVGFIVADAIQRRHKLRQWQRDFDAECARGKIGNEEALLLKPQTYMNESGWAVQAAQQFFKIPLPNVIVIHDEVDLPFLKIRTKRGGSNAGHNGLESISECIGNDYTRIRVGIGHPGQKDLVQSHVLGRFRNEEFSSISLAADVIADSIEWLLSFGIEKFQSQVSFMMRENS